MSRSIRLALLAAAALAIAAPAAGAATALQPGAHGRAVRSLQERLVGLGYLPRGTADGAYGSTTGYGVMAFQKWAGLGRDGVAGPLTLAALRQAHRPHPITAGGGRRIEVLLGRQVVLLILHDRVVRTLSASTARPGFSTPLGSYRIFRKELRSWSNPYKVWLPWASYFVGGVAFHGYADVPAFPASHGCVRLPLPFAPYVYDFAKFGTSVRVLP